MDTSLVYTMGTALSRAQEHRSTVQVLVQGQWMAGRVVGVDGHGLVLERDDTDHAVIRLADVGAVRAVGSVPRLGDETVLDAQPALETIVTTLPRQRSYA